LHPDAPFSATQRSRTCARPRLSTFSFELASLTPADGGGSGSGKGSVTGGWSVPVPGSVPGSVPGPVWLGIDPMAATLNASEPASGCPPSVDPLTCR
jgi:hypothetical protein